MIWDYQTLGSGVEEGGYLLDAEVGLFAMKRDQIQQNMQPFTDAKCELELVQLTPLALYNFLSYDQLGVKAGNPPVLALKSIRFCSTWERTTPPFWCRMG